MKKSNLRLTSVTLLIAALLFIMASCSKTGPDGPQGPQGPSGPAYNTGSIFGFITLYDQYGAKVGTASSLKGIKVIIDGTSKVALTDSTGKYSFSNLNTGTYSITITDTVNPQYAASQVNNIAILLGPSQHDVHLGQIPTFTFTSLTMTDTIRKGIAGVIDTNFVAIRGNINPDFNTRTILVYFGSNSLVSSNPANYFGVNSFTIPANAKTFLFYIDQTVFENAGFTSGSTVYFMTYPAGINYASASEYEDLNTGRLIYNDINTSAGVTSSATVK